MQVLWHFMNIGEENGGKTPRCHESITTAASAALLENAKLSYGFFPKRWKQIKM